jgi:hypothetical protein
LYGTTREFLRVFGLSGVDDLPEVDGLQRAPSWSPPAESVPEPSDSLAEEEQVAGQVSEQAEATPATDT